jgi:rod shape-determining protein MreD
MISDILINIIRFFLLIFLQVLVLDQLEISGPVNGYFNAYLYILFILMLPVNINKLFLLFLSFITGLTIDLFTGTPGMHAAASLVIAFLRPSFLHVIAPREGYESTVRLTMQGMGGSTFLVYAGVLTFVHHLCLLLIEAFNFLNFFDLLLRVLTCSVFTMVLIVMSQILSQRSKGGAES